MIEQYHGRIFRRKDCKPILFDIVDDFGPFHVHYAMRRKYYMQTGAVIRRYAAATEDAASDCEDEDVGNLDLRLLGYDLDLPSENDNEEECV